MTDFEGIAPAFAEALNKRGYTELTPVQKAVLAPELSGADMLVSAQTGSGKTVAFGLALAPTLLGEAERFTGAGAPLALAIAPTRELAIQVKRELEWLYEPTGATVVSCVGGMDMRAERRALERGAQIVVGTPGRLCDHIRRNSLDASELRAVVLDEADEMLDLGFREELEFILEALPAERRTLMFSATVPRSIVALAKKYQRDAVRVTTEQTEKQHRDIEYRAMTVAGHERENAIVNVLRFFEAQNALVFCSTRATVNHIAARFNNRGFSVVALSGELSQKERSNALQAMRDGRARVCIATDVAARGIDLPNLELVIHADLPTNREALLHRSGRTGRAGRKGVSVLIVPYSARKRAERLLASADIRAQWSKPPSADEIIQRDNERILADPALSELVQEDEHGMVSELLSRYGAEQIAAALVRQYRAGQSAPEELLDAGPSDAKKRQRGNFENSVWMSVSVGRKQNAEPRWLLPMLCKAGGITKREIGVIKMQDRETYVQLAAEHADRFFNTIGPEGRLENNIWVRRLDDAPGDVSPSVPRRERSDERPERPRKAYEERPRKPYEGRKAERLEKAEPRRSYDPSEPKRPSKPRREPAAAAANTAAPPAEPRPDYKRPAASASGKPPKKQSKSRIERRARRAAERAAKGAGESGGTSKVASGS